jgi:hypothetical protein
MNIEFIFLNMNMLSIYIYICITINSLFAIYLIFYIYENNKKYNDKLNILKQNINFVENKIIYNNNEIKIFNGTSMESFLQDSSNNIFVKLGYFCDYFKNNHMSNINILMVNLLSTLFIKN